MFLFLFLVTPSIYGDTSDPYTDYTNFKINFGVGFRGPKIYQLYVGSLLLSGSEGQHGGDEGDPKAEVDALQTGNLPFPP